MSTEIENIKTEIAVLKEKHNNSNNRIDKLENDFKEIKDLIKDSNDDLKNDFKTSLESLKTDIVNLNQHRIEVEAQRKTFIKLITFAGASIVGIFSFIKLIIDFLKQ